MAEARVTEPDPIRRPLGSWLEENRPPEHQDLIDVAIKEATDKVAEEAASAPPLGLLPESVREALFHELYDVNFVTRPTGRGGFELIAEATPNPDKQLVLVYPERLVTIRDEDGEKVGTIFDPSAFVMLDWGARARNRHLGESGRPS